MKIIKSLKASSFFLFCLIFFLYLSQTKNIFFSHIKTNKFKFLSKSHNNKFTYHFFLVHLKTTTLLSNYKQIKINFNLWSWEMRSCWRRKRRRRQQQKFSHNNNKKVNEFMNHKCNFFISLFTFLTFISRHDKVTFNFIPCLPFFLIIVYANYLISLLYKCLPSCLTWEWKRLMR